MKFALNKRGRLILACAVAVGAATVGWTQLSGNGSEVEWKDEIQASAAANAIPTAEEVLAEMNLEAGRNKYTPRYDLIASEDTAARQHQSQQDPLSVLTEEDLQESPVAGALSQQSSVKISAVVAGTGTFSPNPAPQYYSASARDSLGGGKGGAGGGSASPEPEKDTQQVVEPEPPIKDIPKGCDEPNGKKANGGKHDEKCQPPDQPAPPPVKPGEPEDPKNPGKPTVSVDEPGTLALFSLGLAGLAAAARRKKKLV